jgi:hypothetical protein
VKTIEEVLTTAVIVAFLEVCCAAEQDQWTLMIKKSKTWIKKEAEKNGITIDVIQWAVTVLDKQKLQ